MDMQEVPVPPDKLYQVWNGEEWADGVDPRNHRDKRREAYKDLGLEPGFENAIGDTMDALFKYILRQNPDAINDPDLGVILKKVSDIKAEYPKGEQESL